MKAWKAKSKDSIRMENEDMQNGEKMANMSNDNNQKQTREYRNPRFAMSEEGKQTIGVDPPNSELIQHAGKRKKKKKANKGRAGRRRDAKLKAIEQLEQNKKELLTLQDVQKIVEDALVSWTPCPSDREKVLPGVTESRKKFGTSLSFDPCPIEDLRNGPQSETPSIKSFSRDKSDGIFLLRQLGFLPGNGLRVAARGRVHSKRILDTANIHHHDAKDEKVLRNEEKEENNSDASFYSPPLVLQLYPLAARRAFAGGKSGGRKFKSRKRGKIQSEENQSGSDSQSQNRNQRDWLTDDGEGVIEPFPTMYWLTCPILKALVSTLEQGTKFRVTHAEDRLKESEEHLQSMEVAHQLYGRERWALLSNEDKDLLVERGWDRCLDEKRGVAGMHRPQTVKCLHAHLAHYLAGERQNVVGKWTLEALMNEFDLDITHFTDMRNNDEAI